MPDYGVDSPRTSVIILLAVIAGIVAGGLLHFSMGSTARVISNILFSLTAVGIFIIFLIWMYMHREKFRHRDRMLDMFTWHGDEQVLDVGTGRGLLLIGAAKRLTTGNGVGVDIWSQKSLSNNIARAVITNAKLEEVKDRITVLDADAQNLPLANSSFDYVLSNLCLHNIKTAEGRTKACQEIVRVLKSGGTILISDCKHTRQYEAEFKALGLQTSRTFSFVLAPMLLYVVKAVK
jgi:ubiquinone/menaquinone biosynthesis C-methylase UbiE